MIQYNTSRGGPVGHYCMVLLLPLHTTTRRLFDSLPEQKLQIAQVLYIYLRVHAHYTFITHYLRH